MQKLVPKGKKVRNIRSGIRNLSGNKIYPPSREPFTYVNVARCKSNPELKKNKIAASQLPMALFSVPRWAPVCSVAAQTVSGWPSNSIVSSRSPGTCTRKNKYSNEISKMFLAERVFHLISGKFIFENGQIVRHHERHLVEIVRNMII